MPGDAGRSRVKPPQPGNLGRELHGETGLGRGRRRREAAPVQGSAVEVGMIQVGMVEVGMIQVGMIEVGMIQLGMLEALSVQIRSVKVRRVKVRTVKVGRVEAGTVEVGTVEVGRAEVPVRHCHATGTYGVAELGFADRRLGLSHDQAVADLSQHLGHRHVERRADGRDELGGGLLLTPLHLREVAEGHPGGGRDLAQRAALPLALGAQHVPEQATQENHRGAPFWDGGHHRTRRWSTPAGRDLTLEANHALGGDGAGKSDSVRTTDATM
jgi:hypothetical protein